MKIQFKKLNKKATMPTRANEGDAGYDLYALVNATLKAGGGRAKIDTGIAVAIPNGYSGHILSRSGLAYKHGIQCLNSPGLIDSGYRGDLGVILVNTDADNDYEVKIGDRIAQITFQAIAEVKFEEVDELCGTGRSTGGFGSSGK